MIDLHTHTFFSDGVLVPAEHVRRFEALGYEAVAITDHGDSSNIDFIIPRIVRAAQDLNKYLKTRLIPGIELTHVPPGMIAEVTQKSRELGAQVVSVHGETVVEPVAGGTNRAAIEAGVDILAHPGFITEEEMQLAAKNKVRIEISGRKGHSFTNGYVVKLAQQAGAQLVLNSDGHEPGDFMTSERARAVALGAGLTEEQYGRLRLEMQQLVAALPVLT